MSVLTDRVSLLDEFFRLVDADASDDDLIEHDTSTGDSYYQLLQAGAYDAQDYIIGIGGSSLWAKTSSALTFTGSFPDRYVAMPSDFLRLDANAKQRRSGLRVGKIGWGTPIGYEDRFRVRGNVFWFQGDASAGVRLYVGDGSAPPTGLVADYIARIGTLADGTTVDFPAEDRQLIPAFAAVRASKQRWFPGGLEEKQALLENLEFCKDQAFQRSRLTRAPLEVGVRPMFGDRWIV